MKRRVLITGASEGIGRAFARRFAEIGFTVTVVARNEERLQHLVDELTRDFGEGEHRLFTADLSQPLEVDRVSDLLRTQKYSILVNNAGFSDFGPFYQTPLKSLRQILKVNCEAVVGLSHAFLEDAEEGDALVNISSSLAFLPMPAQSVYSASKAFVTSFSEALWMEQKKRGIYVLGVCPGATESEFYSRAGGTEQGRPPKAITQTAGQVVVETLAALDKRKQPTLVTGRFNRVSIRLAKFLPRSWVVRLMDKMRA